MQKAFAFDFDGVVLDSLVALKETYFNFLMLHGKRGSVEEFNSLNGPSLSEIVSILKKHHNLEGAQETLFQEYRSLLNKCYLDAPLVDGVVECLRKLKSLKAPIALVTSSIRNEVEAILKRHNLLSMFDYIITGDEVKAAKPAPEIYLKVRERFPEYSWFAIEDSENGLKSAVAAGFRAIFFDPSDCGTGLSILSRVSSMPCLTKRFEELQFDCCVVDSKRDVRVELLDIPPTILSQETLDKIDMIWHEAQERQGLQDNAVLYYARHQTLGNECLIFAFWGPYRYFYARCHDHSLQIPFFPLGVSGICLRGDNRVLVGIRNAVTEYKNRFEFVPSGGLSKRFATPNTVHYAEQLIEEFVEETSLDKLTISSVKTLGLVSDLKHNVLDICCLMKVLPHSFSSPLNNSEYEGLEWITFEDSRINDVIPTSKAMLNLFEYRCL